MNSQILRGGCKRSRTSKIFCCPKKHEYVSPRLKFKKLTFIDNEPDELKNVQNIAQDVKKHIPVKAVELYQLDKTAVT